jgi:uncharacterized protein YbjT (DUF2867 family)
MMQGKLVTVFGGGGFVGRYVVQDLLAAGARVRVAQRNIATANTLKTSGNLGQMQLMAADVGKPASLKRAVADADAVVNLVGSFANMDAVQNIGAGNIAQAAAEAGVAALVHISAIGADANSAADYGRSKAAGEAAVRAAFPGATILRPSIVFGREDAFINRFAGLIRMLPVVPVIGAATKFQPVFVGDVAKAVVAALGREGGETLELGGPDILSMLELNRWIANGIGRDPTFVTVPDFAASLMATTTGWLPGAPITADQFKMLGNDNVVTGTDGLALLDIVPTPLDAVAEGWLDVYRKHGRFAGTTPA